METLTLKDMQFMMVSFQDRIHITIDDVKEAARLLGCNPVYKGFNTREEAEAHARQWERTGPYQGLVFECSEEPRFWVGAK